MSEEKKILSCCEGVSCELEETEEGFLIRVKGEDPEQTEQLKKRLESCCTDSENCC